MDGELNAKFCEVLERKYRYHCSRNGEPVTLAGMLQYAIDAEIIKERTVSHYMVMEMYPAALYNSSGWLEAVKLLSNETGICERTIRGLVNRPKRYTPGKK